jgi:ATP-binding cassette subfamily F protein 2
MEKGYGALQEYIARFGHGSAKLARQAQSKEKTLEKMVRPAVLTLCSCQAHVCAC